MKGLWIRVEAHDVDSRDISRFATALGVSKVMALGHSTALAGAIAEHTDDGRVDTATDEEIERWACWSGKGGRLAKAVRDHLQSPDGTYRDWLYTMGKLVEQRAKDRERKELERLAREAERTAVPRNVRGKSSDVPRMIRGLSSATERNGTERDVSANNSADSLHSESGENGEHREQPASLRSKSKAPTVLPPTALQFLDRFYPIAGKRRADVERQLAKLAAGEILTIGKGQYVQAYSADRLETKCALVIADSNSIHDLNAAIAILFTKLGDTTDVAGSGQLPGQQDAAQRASTEPLDDRVQSLVDGVADELPTLPKPLHQPSPIPTARGRS